MILYAYGNTFLKPRNKVISLISLKFILSRNCVVKYGQTLLLFHIINTLHTKSRQTNIFFLHNKWTV